MQSQVVTLRLCKSPRVLIEAVKSELSKVEYAEMAANPLMLSMLISILSHVVEKTRALSGSLILSRTKLYEIGVQLMLHRASSAKFAMRRGDGDQVVEHDLNLLRGKDCMDLLKRVAYRTHASRKRDIFSEDFVQAMNDLVRRGGDAAMRDDHETRELATTRRPKHLETTAWFLGGTQVFVCRA